MRRSARTLVRPAAGVLLVVALVVLAAGTAAAAERSDTENIDPGSYAAIPIDFQDGPAMEVGYDIQVQEGPNIDVLVMNNANFQKYESGESFSYASDWSDLDTGNTDESFTLQEHGTWYLVLDHTSEPEDGTQPASVGAESATVAWTVSTNVDVEESLRDSIPGPGAGAVALALAAAGLVGARLRRD